MKVVNLKRGPILVLSASALLICFILFSFSRSTQETTAIRDVRIRSIKDERGSDDRVEFPGQTEKKEERRTEKVREEKKEELKKVEKISQRKEEGGRGEGDDIAKKREFVKEMMLHAWYGYRNYTWGYNEIRPSSKSPNNQAIFGGSKMAATIIDAADTLWMMGLKDEYKQARDFIYANFSISNAEGTLSVFETNIRFVGGLLALRALTGEEFYTEKAREVAEALLPAFNTPSGISYSNIDMRTKVASNYGWANGGSSILSEFGSIHLEFTYLSHLTGKNIWVNKVRKIRETLDKSDKIEGGLYSNYMNPKTGRAAGMTHVSLGALGDSFYEYLIKSWIQTSFKDDQAKKMYWDASDAIQRKMIYTSKSGLRFAAELKGGRPDKKMGHLACFCVGMFALEAKYEKNETRKEQVMQLAEDLGHTCHESYVRSESRIGPEMFYFNDQDDATSKRSEHGYILRPEVIEGFFYLWRITGKEKYRDWVWDAISSINKHCRVEGGFTGLQNVYNPNQGRDDVQQSFFLAETLKYAYLTFTPTSEISLDEWVFNTEAHPFPILKGEVKGTD
ncbi:hypothetical protein PENTCL1PPCAC_2060 [Pristionchus entomophagus]|uniref:alpha-1,2-Mannosidase n=1 Tax=Pristionchus entomophagus TaxID=358040 RepID=A0AAV5SBY7_9BILA|nr:hypothetical protein PENTCL1PPCAC_2060 [Pristionchus entomophagus]